MNPPIYLVLQELVYKSMPLYLPAACELVRHNAYPKVRLRVRPPPWITRVPRVQVRLVRLPRAPAPPQASASSSKRTSVPRRHSGKARENWGPGSGGRAAHHLQHRRAQGVPQFPLDRAPHRPPRARGGPCAPRHSLRGRLRKLLRASGPPGSSASAETPGGGGPMLAPEVGAAVVDGRGDAAPGGPLARRLAAAGLPAVWASPGVAAAELWQRAGGRVLRPEQVVVVLALAGHAPEWSGLLSTREFRFEVFPLNSIERDALPAVACRNAEITEGKALLVGHAMALDRELGLARRGLLPLHPTHGACFFPVAAAVAGTSMGDSAPDIALPDRLDVLLHKATDWIRFGPPYQLDGHLGPPSVLVRALEAAAARPGLVLVDPLSHVWRLTNRYRTFEALAGLSHEFEGRVRLPQSQLVHKSGEALGGGHGARVWIGEAGRPAGSLPFPCIVKSNHACGLPGAHRMGVARDEAGLLELLARPDAAPGADAAEVGNEGVGDIPPPWLVQEYVDHCGGVIKVYCAGEAHVTICRRDSPGRLPLAGRPPAVAFRFDSSKDFAGKPPGGGGGRQGIVRSSCRQT